MNLDADGFDHYGTIDYVAKAWAGTPTSIEDGKPVAGGLCLAKKAVGLTNTSIVKVLSTEPSTAICGFAFYAGSLNDAVIFSFKSDSTTQIGLQMTSIGTIRIFRDSTLNIIGTCSGLGILPSTWNYLEIKCTFDSVVGSVQVRNNGVEVFSQSGINTDPANSSLCNAVALGGAASFPFPALRFDDYYINDTNGTQDNDFEGEILIDTFVPKGNATPLDWTPTAGTNYECVDNVPPDETTTYVSSSTSGHIDAYLGENYIRSIINIHFVRTVNFAQKTGAGAANIKHRISSNSVAVSSDPITLTNDFLYSSVLWEKNPDGNVAWTPATISPGNGFNFGPEVE